MKWGRFLLGVAAGAVMGYVLSKQTEEEYIQPEQVVQQMKNRYKQTMPIIGSWIHAEPIIEEIHGIAYQVYQGGLTGVINGEPKYIDFKVDATTGTLLEVTA